MAELHDLVSAYALDALDPEEREDFEGHLAGCPVCEQELRSLQEVVAELPQAVAVDAPPDLKGRIMSQLDGVVVKWLPARRNRLQWALVGAAALLALVFAGLWVATLDRLAEAEQIAAILGSEDSVTLEIDSPVGSARFVYSYELGQGVFLGSEMPTPAGQRVYELWLVGDDGPRAAGTFRPRNGQSTVLVEGVSPGLTVALTVEPAGGSPQPTGDILLSAEL